MNKDSNKYLKENIRIFGCFILCAVIMAALIFHFDSIFGFSDERYIVSFWRDFLYNSPKEYTISALVHGRDLSEYESRRVRGYAIIPIVYLALFSLEVFSEAIAFKHLLKGDDRYCIVGWNMMNFCIIGMIIIDFLDTCLPRDVSSVLFFLTIELFRESFRTFSIRNCIAVDCKESSNE